MRIRLFTILAFLALVTCSGKKDKPVEEPARVVSVPQFNPDSAYSFVKKQVDFGPRIPNSAPHKKTADYLMAKLKAYGAKVIAQNFVATTWDNQRLNLTNIIASFNPEKKKRILLAAHWDTRPFADKDPQKPTATFDGANDGASGVAVLLEIARVIKKSAPQVGVDIILFDGEDWGEHDGEYGTHPLPSGLQEWWCLGSQYWAKNKHTPNYSAFYGILLDMVGGKNAAFAKEGYSLDYAPSIVDKVWNTASRQGFAHIFLNTRVTRITDDHRFVSEIGKIPMIDIISYDRADGFGDFHHTRSDNMDIISKETLQVVGQTLLQVLYYE